MINTFETANGIETLEQELAFVRNEYEALNRQLDSLDTILFTVDLVNNRTVRMSKTCEDIYGYTAEEFMSNPLLWYDVVPEEDRHIIHANYPKMYAGETFSHEHRIITKSGAVKWVQTRISPVNDLGIVTCINGMTNDITSLKNAEQRVTTSEFRFSQLIEKSHDGICLFAMDSTITYCSPSVSNITGYSMNELLGHHALDLIHDNECIELIEGLREIATKPSASVRHSFRLRHAEGHWIWINATITNMLQEATVNALVCNFHDVTDLVNKQIQIDTERRNRDALLNCSTHLMWTFDQNARLLTANKAFIEILRQITGKTLQQGDLLLMDELPKDSIDKWKALYARVFKGETFLYQNHESFPVDSWSEIAFSPVMEGDQVVGGCCTWRDTTEKMKQLKQLEDNERLMSAAQHIGRFGSWSCDFDEKGELRRSTLHWSPEMYRLHGVQKDVSVSMVSYADLIHTDDQPIFRMWVTEVLANQAPEAIEIRIRRSEGEYVWMKTTAQLIIDPKTGQKLRVIGTTQDVTERKSLELERMRFTEDLLERNKALEQFAHIVSHNLRAPVANILGLTSLMKLSDKDSPTYQQCIDGLERSTKRLDDHVVDLNKILHVKRGITDAKETIDLGHLVTIIQESLQQTIESERATIYTDFTEVQEISSIRNYIHSIFINLITNSIKYRRQEVPVLISIRAAKHEDKVRLTFSDNGMGINLERHGDSLFGLYKRFHDTGDGKGMGMYMVKTQVESLGGKIQLSSVVNQGTVITIDL